MTKSVDELFAEADADDAAALEEAEREAAASGKEPFSLARVEELLGQEPGAQAENEVSLRAKYYIRYPELRTLAELAALVRELDAWS